MISLRHSASVFGIKGILLQMRHAAGTSMKKKMVQKSNNYSLISNLVGVVCHLCAHPASFLLPQELLRIHKKVSHSLTFPRNGGRGT